MADIFEPFVLRRDQPLDSRVVTADRNSLDIYSVYNGMVVYDTMSNELFLMIGDVDAIHQAGMLQDSDWELVRSGVDRHDDFEYTIAGNSPFIAEVGVQTINVTLTPTDSNFTYEFINPRVIAGSQWTVAIDSSNSGQLNIESPSARMNSRETITVDVMTTNARNNSIGIRTIQIPVFKYEPVIDGLLANAPMDGAFQNQEVGLANSHPYAYGENIHIDYMGAGETQYGIIAVPLASFPETQYSMYAGGFPLTFNSESSFIDQINISSENTGASYRFYVLPIRRDIIVRLERN